jgi:hypothetical protein
MAYSSQNEGIEGWYAVEPVGALALHLNFGKRLPKSVRQALTPILVKENVRKRPLDAPGGLGRQGAVRKRKGEVHEMNGHKFVQRQFYQLMLCAFCGDFLLNALGYQCEDCRYTCHKKCYEKVVTKCISKSNTGVRTLPSSVSSSSHGHYRRVMKRRSTTASPIALSPSLTLARIGVATAVTCFPSAARTRASVPSATSPAMPTVLTSCLISVACQWRQPTNSSVIGAISIARGGARQRLRRGPMPIRLCNRLKHKCFRLQMCRSAKAWTGCSLQAEKWPQHLRRSRMPSGGAHLRRTVLILAITSSSHRRTFLLVLPQALGSPCPPLTRMNRCYLPRHCHHHSHPWHMSRKTTRYLRY